MTERQDDTSYEHKLLHNPYLMQKCQALQGWSARIVNILQWRHNTMGIQFWEFEGATIDIGKWFSVMSRCVKWNCSFIAEFDDWYLWNVGPKKRHKSLGKWWAGTEVSMSCFFTLPWLLPFWCLLNLFCFSFHRIRFLFCVFASTPPASYTC